MLVLVFSIAKKKEKEKLAREENYRKTIIPERGPQTGVKKEDFISREARRKFWDFDVLFHAKRGFFFEK